MAKKFDPKAKAKRDKVIAGVAGVIFLAVMAFTIPKTLKMMKQPNVAQVTATTAAPAPGAIPLAPPTLDGSSPAPAASSMTEASVASSGQLVSFDSFQSKDPFAPQVSTDPSDVLAGANPSGEQPTSDSEAGTGSLSPSAPTQPPAPSQAAPRPARPVPTAASISVNGAPAETVSISLNFPLPPAQPLFRLVSLSYKGAKIAIAGGSYATGAATVTLKKGKPLTLVNTSDGTRYELRLLWIGVGGPAPAPTTAPPVPAPAAATTTSTTASVVLPTP